MPIPPLAMKTLSYAYPKAELDALLCGFEEAGYDVSHDGSASDPDGHTVNVTLDGAPMAVAMLHSNRQTYLLRGRPDVVAPVEGAPAATPTETVSLPDLAVGDVVCTYGFTARVVNKRDFPARIEGATEGADGPCSQVDLELLEAGSEQAASGFKFLASGRKGGLAMLQGNHLYQIDRLAGV